MADNGRVSFYVIFSDRNCDMNVGTVMVDPTMNFQSLLSVLSQKIGISPYQCNVFLATVGSDRRIPITAKFNLADVLREGGKYYFFVMRSSKPPLPRPPIINRAECESKPPNGSGSGGGGAMCEECSMTRMTGINAGFHLCVNDEVTVGFRSTTGPISRPARNFDKNARH